jgi:hypothetical protein
VVGPTAESNREGIEAIINEALNWERRSGATFEAEKTAIIHFTHIHIAHKHSSEPFTIKEQIIEPKSHVKILGIIMDTKLRYKEHIVKTATKGLKAALKLKRLKGLFPSASRQLFTSTVAPTVDYASNIWMYVIKFRLVGSINKV